MPGAADTRVRHMSASSLVVHVMQEASLRVVLRHPRTQRTHYGLVRLRTYLAHVPQYLNFPGRFYHSAVRNKTERIICTCIYFSLQQTNMQCSFFCLCKNVYLKYNSLPSSQSAEMKVVILQIYLHLHNFNYSQFFTYINCTLI